MLKRYCCRVLLLSLLSPTVSLALGLGDIHLDSALNARLDADIDVVGASPEDLAALQATLASREAFTRSGDDYPSFLGALTFTSRKTADGRNVIHVSSANLASEPFATLLVEVNWARGHLVREYTVLLDPPVFSSQAASNVAVAAPAVDTAVRNGTVERGAAAAPADASSASPSAGPSAVAAAPVAAPSVAAPTATPAPPAAPPRPTAAAAAPAAAPSSAASGAPASSYTVKPGDTLYSIAGQAYPQADRSARPSELVAIYRANPAAFGGNMNLVRSGSRLRLPGDTEVAAISPGDASAEVHRQYSAWNGGRAAGPAAGSGGAGQLRLVPPQEGAATPASGAATAGAAAAAGTGNTAALQQQVQQLQAQLADTQRLLQMRSTELAALQARAAQSANAAAAPAPPPVAPTPAPVNSAAPTVPPPSPVTAAAPPSPAPPSAAAPAEKPKSPSSATANESGNSMLDLIVEYWYVPAALVAVLIVLMVVRVVRARQEDEFDRSLGRLTQPAMDPSSTTALRSSDTQPVRAMPVPRDEPSYHVEESGLQHVLEPPPPERAGATAQNVAIDSSVTGQTPVALDQGDPLAETDFHMAYGLYEQAVDLVQTAIAREPNRRDLKLKLLEVFFVWGNHDRFVQSAHELAGSRDKALPGEWEKIVIMGRQIAPEDSLFANRGALAGAASGGVDLNLEGGQNRVDFDLLGEPSANGGPDVGVDLDLGAALGETALSDSDPTGEPHQFGSRVDSTGSTREMPVQGDSPTRRSPEAEIPTVEQPHLRGDDNSTIQQKIDLAARAGMISSEQTAELALDDLGLDLGELENTVDEPVALDKTVESRKGAAGAELTPSTSGTWMFNDTDFVSALSQEGTPTQVAPSISEDSMTVLMTQAGPRPTADNSVTSQMPALDTDGMDLDLGDLHSPEAANGLDLDVGTAAEGEGTYLPTQKMKAEDMAMPELEPATMSEVGTKLDLARAYMDMGDPEGARSILAEVLSEGSVSQKQEARRLMDTLPG